MRGGPRVARLAAGSNSAERRVQTVFTAMQKSIAFDAGTRGLLSHKRTPVTWYQVVGLSTRGVIFEVHYLFKQHVDCRYDSFGIIRVGSTSLEFFPFFFTSLRRVPEVRPTNQRSARWLWAYDVIGLVYVGY